MELLDQHGPGGSMKTWRFLLFGALIFGVAAPACIEAQQPTPERPGGRQGIQAQPAVGEALTLGEALTVEQLRARLTTAEKAGYKIEFYEQPCDVLKRPKGCAENMARLSLIKEGKTAEGHGILGVRWDQRERWVIFLAREGDRFKLIASEGVREEKAPVAGTWREIAKFNTLPSPWKLGENR